MEKIFSFAKNIQTFQMLKKKFIVVQTKLDKLIQRSHFILKISNLYQKL